MNDIDIYKLLISAENALLANKRHKLAASIAVAIQKLSDDYYKRTGHHLLLDARGK